MAPERSAPSGRRRRWRLVLARREAVPASLRRLMSRAAGRLRRGHRPRRRMALGLGAAGLAVLVVVAGLLVFYQTSLLAVRGVRVAGAGTVPAATVRTAAAVSSGTPLADVDLDAVRRRVERLPPVRSASVERSWPHTIVVRIVERTAVAGVPDGSRSRLIDAAGVVFRTVAGRPAGLPVVQLAHPGSRDASTRAALRVLAALTPQLRERLVRVEAPRPTRIRLILHNGPTIVWGDASSSARKAATATALLGKDATTIDVSAPDLAVVR